MSGKLNFITMRLLIACLIAICCSAAYCADVPLNVNILTNPGFEDGAKRWYVSPATEVKIVSEVSYSGNNSTKLSRTTETGYRYIAQSLQLTTGCRYRFSAWINGDNLIGIDASIWAGIRWFDTTGKEIARWEAMTPCKGQGWIKLEGLTSIIPNNAARIDLTIGLPQKCSGYAYVDDISVEVIDDIITNAMLTYPNYRSTIYPGMQKSVKLGIDIADTTRHLLDQMYLDVTVQKSDDQTLAKVTKEIPKKTNWDSINIDMKNATAGEYKLIAVVKDKNTNLEICRRELPFYIAEQTTPLPKVYVDEHNRIIADGKPFFPIGFYIDFPTNDILDFISNSGFNCLMSYPLYVRYASEINNDLDAINEHNLKILFPLNTCYDAICTSSSTRTKNIWGGHSGAFEVFKAYVDSFKNHPAILGWYVGDDMGEAILPQIKQRCDYLKSTEPNHPSFLAYTYPERAAYLASSVDIVGSYNYPVLRAGSGETKLENFGKSTEIIQKNTLNARPIIMVPECSSQKEISLTSRAPSYHEMLCEAYQGLIHGGRGLIFYILPFALKDDGDLQKTNIRRLGENLNAIKDIALGIDASPNRCIYVNDSRISVLTRNVGDEIYVLAVNPYNVPVPGTFKTGSAMQAKSIAVGVPGVIDRTIAVNGNTFTDNIEANGVRVYKIVR